MSPVAALFLAVALPVRTLSLDTSAPTKPVRIACPKGETTRIVFPEPFLPGGVRASRGATDALGIVLEMSRPAGVITVRPESHPVTGTLTLRGPSVAVTLLLWTAAEGAASEIRVVVAGPGDPARPKVATTAIDRSAPTGAKGGAEPVSSARVADGRALGTEGDSATPGTAQVIPVAAPAPTYGVLPTLKLVDMAPPSSKPTVTAGPLLLDPQPVPQDLATSRSSSPEGTVAQQDGLDLKALLLAQPEHIGRREGLPGQPPLTLDDALKSEEWVWLRFTLPGGAESRLEAVSWENGLISASQTRTVKSDLRIVVQLPRMQVTKRTRITLKLAPGGSYKFALSAPWLSTFVRGLF